MIGFDTPSNTERLAAAIKADGYDYVGRYYSWNPSKNLTLPEATALSAAGLDILSIWEARGDLYSTFTSTNGTREAGEALRLAQAISQPKGSAIYFAVDFDATDLQTQRGVTSYFTAVNNVLRGHYLVGVYGSGAVCQSIVHAGLATFSMLGGAPGWRGSKDIVGFDIVQGLPTTDHGLDVDRETVIRLHATSPDDIGAWRLTVTVTVSHPTLRLGSSGADVTALQQRLAALGYDPGSADGDFGHRTERALMRFQTDHEFAPDGIAGPLTNAILFHVEQTS